MSIISRQCTHMSPRSKLCRLNCIFMEPFPLFECIFGSLLVFVVFPMKHMWRIIYANGLTVCFNHLSRVVQQVVCIDHADVGNRTEFIGCIIVISAANRISRSVMAGSIRRRTRKDWPYKSGTDKEVKHSANFIIPGFGWVELVEARDFVKWRNGATVVRGNAVMRISD